MTDHDTDVATVPLTDLAWQTVERLWDDDPSRQRGVSAIGRFRAALTAAGYAVVKLPEGVEVEHGTRLVQAQGKDDFEWFAIGARP